MTPPDRQFFVAPERCVWQALADGEVKSDAELLDPDFPGVYVSGFAPEDTHVAQLRDSLRVGRFWIDALRLPPLPSGAALRSYRATFSRPGGAEASAPQTLFKSSIWKQRGASCVNVFNQDAI